eukprot:scaffold301520_cov37-Tisochrysis_lutea.AAC.2
MEVGILSPPPSQRIELKNHELKWFVEHAQEKLQLMGTNDSRRRLQRLLVTRLNSRSELQRPSIM